LQCSLSIGWKIDTRSKSSHSTSDIPTGSAKSISGVINDRNDVETVVHFANIGIQPFVGIAERMVVKDKTSSESGKQPIDIQQLLKDLKL